MREAYETRLRLLYPRECGSCSNKGAPGYCGRNMTHGIPCKPGTCRGYFPDLDAMVEFRALEERGLLTGDASVDEMVDVPVSPDYLWIRTWKTSDEFIDHHEGLKVALNVAKQSLQATGPELERPVSVPFDKITTILLVQGGHVTTIHDTPDLARKPPRQRSLLNYAGAE